VKSRRIHPLWILTLVPVALIVFFLVDGDREHLVGRNELACAVGLQLCVSALIYVRAGRAEIGVHHPNRCMYCGYDLIGDARNPRYCPRCGSSRSQQAHLRRRRELMLELERLQLELVANHRSAGRDRWANGWMLAEARMGCRGARSVEISEDDRFWPPTGGRGSCRAAFWPTISARQEPRPPEPVNMRLACEISSRPVI